jgi:mono/diheme cytochrome c family protein
MRRALLCLITLAGCSDAPTTKPTVNAIRGEYLVTAVLECGDCHTTPQPSGLPSFDPKDFLAGGRAFLVDIGGVTQKFYSRNLTSDKQTGLGNWTDDQIKRAFTHGIDDQGKALSPIMPYAVFGNMSDDDATSIVLFLRSLPARANSVSDNTVPTAMPAPLLDKSRIPHTTLPSSDPNFASAEHGRYLAGEMGACIDCHTKHGADGLPDLSRAFGGGEIFELGPITTVSHNLTPDATGLQGWTATDVIKTLQTDQERGTGRILCPPMPGGPNRLGDMTPSDLTDIANYITTLPSSTHGPYGCTDAGLPYGLDGG